MASIEQQKGGALCGVCIECGKCNRLLDGRSNEDAIKKEEKMEQDNSVRLYTFIIYSENVPGLLSQITAAFTRRQVNIESLNVCASSTPGAHKYTITANCDRTMALMLTKQIEKRIDVLQANFFTDDEIFINETCLLKISTPVMLENKNVGRMVRLHNAHIVEVNSKYATVVKTGITSDILSLYNSLKSLGCVLQFVRSGRICITKDFTEHLDEYLADREKKRNAK